MKTNQKIKILWAVDAFDQLPQVQKNILKIFQTFARQTSIEVTPVYVLSPDELGVPVEFTAQWTVAYVPPAKSALAEILKQVSVPGLQESQVLVQNRASTQGSAELLSQYASANEFDLLIVGSHGRRGFKRLMLGSFAEELVLKSLIPILVVGSHSEEWTDQGINILLANDLKDPEARVFSETFDLAQILGAKVTLLNAVARPAEIVFQSGVYLMGGAWVSTANFLESERTQQHNLAQAVVAQGRDRKIACDYIVDDTSMSVTESVLRHAREKQVQLIVMEAESGPVATVLIGSIARQVVRSASCPVLIYRFKK